MFDRLIQVLEAAQTAKAAMKGKITEDMEAAQAKVEGALGMVLEGFDQFTGSLLDEAEAVTRRAGRGPAARGGSRLGAAAPTPISNRGVRFDQKATKDIAQSRLTARPKASKSGVKTRGVK